MKRNNLIAIEISVLFLSVEADITLLDKNLYNIIQLIDYVTEAFEMCK